MEASILLLLVSLAIAVSSLFDAFSLSTVRLKVVSAAFSLLLAALPLMIKLYFFYCEKRTRRKLLLDASIRYFLGDAFPLYNFKSWCGGYSTYTNIFCDKKAFFSNQFYSVSVTVPSVNCDVNNVVTFGHILSSDPNYTPQRLEESRAAYVTERVHFNAFNGELARGTLVVRDYIDREHNGLKYSGFKGEMFVRGDHKFERRAPFIPSEWVDVTYPKVYETPSLGEVKVTLRYDHINSTIDYRIQTTDFPEGLFTPKVRDCNVDIFTKCIIMLEYMPDSGWVTCRNKSLGRRRRGAFVFHSSSLNGFTKQVKLGANLYEVGQQTNGLPCFID